MHIFWRPPKSRPAFFDTSCGWGDEVAPNHTLASFWAAADRPASYYERKLYLYGSQISNPHFSSAGGWRRINNDFDVLADLEAAIQVMEGRFERRSR
jgi:hypothetical protein